MFSRRVCAVEVIVVLDLALSGAIEAVLNVTANLIRSFKGGGDHPPAFLAQPSP
jgi:hypothetical protein